MEITKIEGDGQPVEVTSGLNDGLGVTSKYLKWRHPKFSGWLITETNETRENVAENYLGINEEPGDLEAFTIEEIEMTKEEFETLPEFEG